MESFVNPKPWPRSDYNTRKHNTTYSSFGYCSRGAAVQTQSGVIYSIVFHIRVHNRYVCFLFEALLIAQSAKEARQSPHGLTSYGSSVLKELVRDRPVW